MDQRTWVADQARRAAKGLAILVGVGTVACCLAATPALAGDYTMGNYDLSGSRSIPSSREPALSREAVENRGLEVKHFLPTDHPVAAVPVVANGVVYVGDLSFASFGGSVYAFDVETGELEWKTDTGGIVASPLISGAHVYVGTLTGTLHKLDRRTGAIEASATPSLRPGFDSIWSGPMKIGGQIIIAINPNDEFPGPLAPGGLGAVIALDARTLSEIWRFVPVDNDVDEPPVAGEQYGGAGIWNTQLTYSPELGLLFMSTGQNTYSTDGRTPGSDSVFAINLKDGTLAWQTQTVDGDIWNLNEPFYYDGSSGTPPRDTDIGDAPAFFWWDSDPYVAVGSKRGYFYVMDARNGMIVNGSGRDGLGFLRGLEVLPLPGPGIDGGFNLDSGYFSDDDRLVHFGIVHDYAGQFDTSSDHCFGGGFGLGPPECPGHVSFSHLVLLDAMGVNQLGRYSNPNAAITTPVELDGMVFVRETVDLTTFDVDKLLVIDVSDPMNPAPIVGATVDLPNTRSIGAHLSISGGLVFTGSGFFSDAFGSPVGVHVIGLK